MIGHLQLMAEQALLHGSCLAVGDMGVLLLGEPGSGKSDLTLRMIDQPGTGLSGNMKSVFLVADDQVVVRFGEGRLWASAPAILAGRMEIRGLGLVTLAHRAEVPLVLAVRLTAVESIERLPELEKSYFEVLGKRLPMILIDPASASAPARIRAVLDWLE